MKHFLEISQLDKPTIEQLLSNAAQFKQGQMTVNHANHYLANLFYENSTRTRASFEIAATRLGIPVLNLELATSSENKGETIQDTIHNLAAMGVNLFVIRHQREGIQQILADSTRGLHIINAGDGTHAHPSQAMLDLMTIVEHKPNLSQLKIAIIGDLRHSRVANSLQCLCKIMGVGQLALVAPSIWQPQKVHFGSVTDSLKEGLKEADVVICLRIQRERLLDNEVLDLNTYRQYYAITAESLKFANKEAIVMHPGPINRGVELDDAVADGPQSVILKQVQNGVFMRMAIINQLLV